MHGSKKITRFRAAWASLSHMGKLCLQTTAATQRVKQAKSNPWTPGGKGIFINESGMVRGFLSRAFSLEHPAAGCLTIPATNKCKILFLENLVNPGSSVCPWETQTPLKEDIKKNGNHTGRPPPLAEACQKQPAERVSSQ